MQSFRDQVDQVISTEDHEHVPGELGEHQGEAARLVVLSLAARGAGGVQGARHRHAGAGHRAWAGHGTDINNTDASYLAGRV